MPSALQGVVNQWLRDPVEVKVAPVATTAAKINQSVMFVDQKQKLYVLTHWLQSTAWTRALVFSRTKHGADKIAKHLSKCGIAAEAFHSNKSQSARQRTLRRFQAPKPLVLVATDIAARGLDIDQISHVVNFDLPMDPESYVHRIGRTGRAGAEGVALSLCSGTERKMLSVIQRLTRQRLPVTPSPAGVVMTPPSEEPSPKPAPRAARPQGGGERPPGKKRFGKPDSFGKRSFGKPRRRKATSQR